VSPTKIEMLFIHPDVFGKGIGKLLFQFAIRELSAHTVDVNEQNKNAVGFYLKMGFKLAEVKKMHKGMTTRFYI